MKYILSICIIFFCFFLVYAIFRMAVPALYGSGGTENLHELWNMLIGVLRVSLFQAAVAMVFLAFFPVGLRILMNQDMRFFSLLVPFAVVCSTASVGAVYLLYFGGFEEMVFSIWFYGNILIYSAQSLFALFVSRLIIRTVLR